MQFKYTKFASALLATGLLSLPFSANANDSTELEELRSLVQELSQQVKVLARKGEINEEAAAAAKKETPVVKASSSAKPISSPPQALSTISCPRAPSCDSSRPPP